MRVSKTVTTQVPVTRQVSETVKDNEGNETQVTRTVTEMKTQTRTVEVEVPDENNDRKVDRAEFEKTEQYQSADERQRETLDRVYSEAAGADGTVDTEEAFNALAQGLAEHEVRSAAPASAPAASPPEPGTPALDSARENASEVLDGFDRSLDDARGDFPDASGDARDTVNGLQSEARGRAERMISEAQSSADQLLQQARAQAENLAPAARNRILQEADRRAAEIVSNATTAARGILDEAADLGRNALKDSHEYENMNFFEKRLADVGNMFDAIGDFVGNLADRAVEAFNDVKDFAAETIDDFKGWLGEQFDNVTNGFFDELETEVVRRPDPRTPAEARDALQETAAQEHAALERLSPTDREAYQAIAARVDGDPVAHMTLRDLLLDGRLPGANDKVAGKSLLQNLAVLSDMMPARGIDRAELVANVLAQVADPVNIHQRQFNTCGPTTAQLVLAMQEPAEYVRIAAGLASPSGRVSLQNGDEIRRQPDWNQASEDDRTLSNQLFQSALMEYANGRFNYSNTQDGRTIGVGPVEVAIPGLLPNEMEELVEGLTGRDHAMNLSIFDDTPNAAFMDALRQAGPGHEMPILVNYSNDGSGVQNTAPHYLLVTGFDAETGMVSITNPWGREEQIALDALQRHMIASLPQVA